MRFIGARGAPPPALSAAAPGAVAAAARSLAAGKDRINFSGSVYASTFVRARLNELQHGKCAYCEVKILPVSTPHVDHFRPKAGYVDETTGGLVKPGYHWLAYSWTNLLLACPMCNSPANKGNRFPLADETTRATGPAADLSLEEPQLIDPFAEPPNGLIGFRRGVAYAIGGDARAVATIDVLGLNREALVDAREDQISDVVLAAAAVTELAPGPTRRAFEAKLANLISPRGQFHACLQAFLNSVP